MQTTTNLIVLNASGGLVRWSNPALANADLNGPDNDIFYASLFSSSSAAPTTTLEALNVSDGSLRWSQQIKSCKGEALSGGGVNPNCRAYLLVDGVIYQTGARRPIPLRGLG